MDATESPLLETGHSHSSPEIKHNKLKWQLGLALVILFIIVIGMATHPVYTTKADSTTAHVCPADYRAQPPVILISLDGFRANYRQRGMMPTLEKLASEGVSAPFMYPSYPTITFPNHYTIVTGLYPESHGIIANTFYDPEFDEAFSLSDPASKEGRWWGGEPMWNTLTKQGKKSATYFWPGSDADIEGMYPTYWFPYNTSAPYEDRVDQVLEWVQLPADDRPVWITLYFDEPDHTGHKMGPDSEEVNGQLVRMDGLLSRLVDGLTKADLMDCVNIIIVADHGMAAGGPSWVIKLSDYLPEIYDTAYSYTGAFTRINPKEESEAVKHEMMRNLSCQRPDMRQYEREGLPTRFHFSNNRRIEDIILDLDPGRYGSVSSDWYNKGNHGYDNYFNTMHALFVARGPAFNSSITMVVPFQNTELYNLMCNLTGVKPAPNNGTWGSLNHLLVNPVDITVLPQELLPPVLEFPSNETLQQRLSVSNCPGDLTEPEPWLYALNMSLEQQGAALSWHLPWGAPQTGQLNASVSLLYHPDHVTGYSSELQMPLWTSSTLDPGLLQGSEEAEWSSDVRLKQSVTCDAYQQAMTADNTTLMTPLFPPAFSTDRTLSRIPYLVTNSVPSSDQQQKRRNQLIDYILSWLAAGQINIVTGPVFDDNADSIVDTFSAFQTTPAAPSDLFVVLTRCSSGGDVTTCNHRHLQTRAFIYPTLTAVENCLESKRYALEFSATVRDIRRVTGLILYPSLSYKDRTAIEVAVHSILW